MMLSNLKHRTARLARNALLSIASLGLAMAWSGAALTATSATLLAPQPALADEAQRGEKDVVIFHSGREVQGHILEETPTTIRMKVLVAGIAAETSYNKSDILTIMRGTGAPADEPAEEARPALRTTAAAASTAASPGAPDRKRVYVLELTGLFGLDISQTPVRQAVQDARNHQADYIIVVLDNDWSLRRIYGLDIELPEDAIQHNIGRAGDIEVIFREEIQREWENPPTVVYWIKNAMGTGAFLPLSCPNIYFHSEGRMGGIGHLNRILGGRGDEVVRQKMYSAMLSQAVGFAVAGGYDPRIIRAMTWTDYVLSVRFEGGRPVFIEDYPQDAGDILLTDDGKEDRADTDEQLARGEGNDVLTLRADLAYKLGFSRGTADTMEDLIFLLGIARNHEIINGRAEHIMQQWSREIDEAPRTLRRLWRDYQEVQGGNDIREQRRAISRRIALIDQMQRIIRRFEEAIAPQWYGVPSYHDLNILKEQHRLQLMGLRR